MSELENKKMEKAVLTLKIKRFSRFYRFCWVAENKACSIIHRSKKMDLSDTKLLEFFKKEIYVPSVPKK